MGIAAESITQLLRRGAVLIVTGTALITIGSIVGAEIDYLRVAKLVALGGTVDSAVGEVSFPTGTLSDADLPVVVECLNRSEDWYVLNLANTNVTGDGLKHLQKISNAPFRLELSIEQLGADGLNHLRQIPNLANFDEINASAAAAGRETSRDNAPADGE